MKGFLKVIIVIAILIAIPVACIKMYRNHESNNKTVIKPEASENINDSGDYGPNMKLYDVNELPRVDASKEVQPLMTALLSNFTGEKIDDKKLEYTDTHSGYLALVDGEKDLLIVTEPSEEELEYAESKNVKLTVVPFFKENSESSQTNYCIVFRENEVSSGVTKRIVYDMISLRGKKVAESVGYTGIR